MTESPWSHLLLDARTPAGSDADGEYEEPRFGSIEVVGALLLLVSLQVIQVLLFRAGGSPDTMLGLEAETFRYFPTAITAYVVLVLTHRRGFSLGEFGFRRPRSWRPSVYAWAGAVLIGPAYAAVLLIAGIDTNGLGTAATFERYIDWLTRPSTLLLIFGVVILAPVVEEIIFRGLVYRAIRQRWAVLPAVVVTGIIFAAFHYDEARLIPLVFIGAFFAFAYERTGSLWGSIVAHAGLNAMVVAVTVLN